MFRKRKAVKIRSSVEEETGHEILIVSLRKNLKLEQSGNILEFVGSPARVTASDQLCEGLDISRKVIYRAEFLKSELCLHGQIDSDLLRMLLSTYSCFDRVLFLKDSALCDHNHSNSGISVELCVRSSHWGGHGLAFSSSSLSPSSSSTDSSLIISDISSECPACPWYDVKRVFIGKEIYRISILGDINSVSAGVIDIECGSSMTCDDVIKILRFYSLHPVRKLFLREIAPPPPTERIRMVDYNEQFIDVSPVTDVQLRNDNGNMESVSSNEGIKNKREPLGKEGCVVCFGQKSVVLQPCRHYCCCESCSLKLRHCPLCRVKIEKFTVFEN